MYQREPKEPFYETLEPPIIRLSCFVKGSYTMLYITITEDFLTIHESEITICLKIDHESLMRFIIDLKHEFKLFKKENLNKHLKLSGS